MKLYTSSKMFLTILNFRQLNISIPVIKNVIYSPKQNKIVAD